MGKHTEKSDQNLEKNFSVLAGLKGKCNSKEREKEYSKLLSSKGRVHFLAKKCWVNMRKVMLKGNAEGRVFKLRLCQ
jgi:hypothetical protein